MGWGWGTCNPELRTGLGLGCQLAFSVGAGWVFSLSSLGAGLGSAVGWLLALDFPLSRWLGCNRRLRGVQAHRDTPLKTYFILEGLGALGLGVESFNGPVLRGLRPVVVVGISKLYS